MRKDAATGKWLADAFGLDWKREKPAIKIVLIFFDKDAGKVRARFEVKATGEQFERDEKELIARIMNAKRTRVDVRVEEVALYLLQRMTTLIKKGYYG